MQRHDNGSVIPSEPTAMDWFGPPSKVHSLGVLCRDPTTHGSLEKAFAKLLLFLIGLLLIALIV